MFCKNCGKEIDDKAVVCIHCGVATDNLNGGNQSGGMNANQSGAPQKKLNVLALVGLIISAVGLIGFNYIFLAPSIAGLILSIIGIVKSKDYSAPGLAIASIIVSAIVFFIWLIIWIAIIGNLAFATVEMLSMI